MAETKDGETTVLQLRETIGRLRNVIDLNLLQINGGGSGVAKKALSKRQHELEVALLQLAEKTEASRIQHVRRSAIESGFVIQATKTIKHEECPLCLEVMPEWYGQDVIRFSCCGALCCTECATKHNNTNAEALLARALVSGMSLQEQQQVMPLTCPFCRARVPYKEEGHDQNNLRQAQAGKSWAQHAVGVKFLTKWVNHGENDKEAEEQAVHWLTLAAEQGETDAQSALARMWFKGTASMPKSYGKALALFLPLARMGQPAAQRWCAKILWEQQVGNRDNDASDALVWCTLAAAQKDSEAQERLGAFYYDTRGRSEACDGHRAHAAALDEALFKALYWTRKAALRGNRIEQATVSAILIDIKKRFYDGDANRVGHSCLPEMMFWRRQLALVNGDNESKEGLEYACVQSCGCCGRAARFHEISKAECVGTTPAATSLGGVGNVTPGLEIKIQRCLQCRSVGYCSVECQRKHWKVGHKVDCLQVKALEEAMKASTSTTGAN